MPGFIAPTPDFRSPAAAEGLSGFRDDLVYSAVAVSDGASGSVNAFAQGQGGSIQSLGTMTNAQTHQKTFSLTTTNLSQSGVVGSNIGDIGIREIGISVEQAWTSNTAAAALPTQSTYGAGVRELCEILNKMSYQLNLINKPMQQGPVFAFGNAGGPAGSVSVAQNSTAASSSALAFLANNGTRPRHLEVALVVSRIDTIQGQFTVAGGDSLSFTTSGGNPTLLWNVFFCNVAADLVG